MPNTNELPRGIRNNNPGNLRRIVVPECPGKIIDNFAVFTHMSDGLWNLAHLCLSYYNHLKKITPYDFVMTYAPPNENDSVKYTRFIASWLRCPPGAERTFNMRLDKSWNLFDLIRGITIMENGWPPSAFSVGGEWFAPQELWYAIDQAAKL